jgi:hypothetical protein
VHASLGKAAAASAVAASAMLADGAMALYVTSRDLKTRTLPVFKTDKNWLINQRK